MHRIDGANATPDHKFTDGDPVVGALATVLTDDWGNAIQEEVCSVIEGAGIALVKADNTQLKQAIQLLLSSAIPAGAVMFFAMAAPPSGWLERNGQAVSRTTYARLFAAIGVTYGLGDGTTTFNLPDDRGEFFRAWDHGRGVDPGRTLGSLQSDQLEAHTHTYRKGDPSSPGTAGGGDANIARIWNDGQATGSTGGTETRPRNRAYLACIKT